LYEFLLTQLDKQISQKASQLAEAQATVAQLRADSSTADAAMRSLKLQSSQQQEQMLDLQQAVLRCAVSLSLRCWLHKVRHLLTARV
jgi:chromosome segregation ATPase